MAFLSDKTLAPPSKESDMVTVINDYSMYNETHTRDTHHTAHAFSLQRLVLDRGWSGTGSSIEHRAIPLFHHSTIPLFHSTVPYTTESRHPPPLLRPQPARI